MAESLGDKLKRIAAEKKAARELAEKVTEVTSNEQPSRIEGTVEERTSVENVLQEDGAEVLPAEVQVEINNGATSSVVIAERTTSEHPLSMQFAEMEQALLAADPTFKTILRDVHRQLGQDPELVTMMTEDEIALVVGGLVKHANADIIEPAKAKTVKKAVAEAKKKAISADDL